MLLAATTSLCATVLLSATTPTQTLDTTGDAGVSALLLVGLGLLGLWLLSLLLHPFTSCGSCQGTPRSYGSVATRSFRLCGSCGGTGRRLRVGARVWPQNRE